MLTMLPPPAQPSAHHQTRRMLTTEEWGAQVQVEHPIPIRRRDVEQGRPCENGGVVHKDVQASEGASNFVE